MMTWTVSLRVADLRRIRAAPISSRSPRCSERRHVQRLDAERLFARLLGEVKNDRRSGSRPSAGTGGGPEPWRTAGYQQPAGQVGDSRPDNLPVIEGVILGPLSRGRSPRSRVRSDQVVSMSGSRRPSHRTAHIERDEREVSVSTTSRVLHLIRRSLCAARRQQAEGDDEDEQDPGERAAHGDGQIRQPWWRA